MKRAIAVLMLFLIGVLFSACNTMRGMGEDIQQGGQALEKAATKK